MLVPAVRPSSARCTVVLYKFQKAKVMTVGSQIWYSDFTVPW